MTAATALATAVALDPLDVALERAAHLLPVQGPIGVFVHHNTLHAFADRPFEEAVLAAASTFGAEPYMSEEWYAAELGKGRITLADLDQEIDRGLGEAGDEPLLGGRVSRRALRRILLVHPLQRGDDAYIRWLLEEDGLVRRYASGVSSAAKAELTGETTRWLSAQLRTAMDPAELFRDPTADAGPDRLVPIWLGASADREGLEAALRRDGVACSVAALWAAVTRRVHGLPRPLRSEPKPTRLRDRLRAETGVDTDDLVHPLLIPIVAAYLDQGVAYWSMQAREVGLYRACRQLVLDGDWLPIAGLRELRAEFADQAERDCDARTVVGETLETMGVDSVEDVVEATLLALPGWAGLIHRLAGAPELAPMKCPPCDLVDFLAIRLMFDAWAARRVAREHLGHRGPLATLVAKLRRTPRPPHDHSRAEAFAAFQVLQRLGISVPAFLAMPERSLVELVEELRRFDSPARREVLHLAYERRFRTEVLGALAAHRADVAVDRTRSTPSLQIAFCIDDREESVRRHLEEVDPTIETFGAAGFFAAAISYRGLDDGTSAALCPVVQTPQHAITEVGVDEDLPRARRRVARRRLWSTLARGGFVGSRSLVRGWIATFGFGVLSAIPLASRVLFPRQLKRLRQRLLPLWFPQPRTRLALERAAEARASLDLFPGFTTHEMADRVMRLLQDIGLTRNFARLVATIGHGSTTLNNPHSSAYDCGACGGRKGAPNGRLFPQMANHPEVRRLLAERGLPIPETTWFIGGYHDTCSDDIELFDLEQVPESHREDLQHLRRALDAARTRNAHERCRRFESASLHMTPEHALRHVEGRAADLGEPRPECGHATNAICVFGRRTLTRGLFLDRRAFLVSYDPTIDPDAEIIGRLLNAMGPVGAGINLEYYFSFVDNERYGCGTKLPHNVTGLLGVMNGHQSDLRTGLPWQMVEIHEPVRLLVVVESTPDRIAKVASRFPDVRQLVELGWIQLALCDPETGAYCHYVRDRNNPGAARFEPVESLASLLTVQRSVDWYRGRRDHLPIVKLATPTPLNRN